MITLCRLAIDVVVLPASSSVRSVVGPSVEVRFAAGEQPELPAGQRGEWR
jgi:hypothetical protein